MAKIDDILQMLMSSIRARESATFSTRTYDDEPIIQRGSDLQERIARREAERAKRRTAERARRQQAQHPQATSTTRPVGGRLFTLDPDDIGAAPEHPTLGIRRSAQPKRIREMRKLESGAPRRASGRGFGTPDAKLFLEQARLMEDYEDSYEFSGSFMQYFPTYASMSDHQLRGYFTWRTRVRAGNVTPAPLSFAFIYVYELLAGVGTIPGIQGLHDLKAFGEAWAKVENASEGSLKAYLDPWLRDYAIYHDIASELERPAIVNVVGRQVQVLMRAEHAQLAEAGMAPRVPNEMVSGPAPSAGELFMALGACARYHILDARLTKAEPELVERVSTDVFAALVTHCAKRRKTDFVEGLFGYGGASWHSMFQRAVFYEEQRHADATVRVDDFETYRCKDGFWQHIVASEATGTSKELGDIMHAIDFELREQLAYDYPLKARKVPKYLTKIVHDAVAARLAERAEAERRRITIDRSKLRGIRAAAALTQEALLTDEERGEQPAAVVPALTPTAVEPAASPAPFAPLPTAVPDEPPATPTPVAPATAPAPAEGDDAGCLLTPLEARFLAGLLEGVPASQILAPTDPFASVVADAINEKLFDLVGDAVIEFDGDEPQLIEDYLDDIREVLQA